MKADIFRNKISNKIILPKDILVISLLGMLIAVVFVYIEYQDRQKDLLKLLENQSALFIRTLSSSAHNAILAGDKFEDEFNQRVITSIDLIEQLDRKSELTRVDLERFLKSIQVDELHIYNSEYSIVLMSGGNDREPRPVPKNILKSKIQEGLEKEFSTSIEIPDNREKLTAFIVPRKRGGAIVGLVTDEHFRSLRNVLGLGYFLKSVQAIENVEYVVLQNDNTIIAGSFKNYKLSSFMSDPLLQQAMLDNEMKTRIIRYDGQSIFEGVSRFEMYDIPIGVLRLGLSMHEYEQLMSSTRTRTYIFTAVIIIIGTIFINFAASYRHRHLHRKDIDNLQGHTNAILNNLQSGVLCVDKDGIIQSANKQALLLLEYDIGDIYRKPLNILCLEIQKAITECMRTSETNNTDTGERILFQWKNRTIHLRSRIINDDAIDKMCIILLEDVSKQFLLDEQIRFYINNEKGNS